MLLSMRMRHVVYLFWRLSSNVITLRIDQWYFFFFQAEDGIRDVAVTGVQTCALPISISAHQQIAIAPEITNVDSLRSDCDLLVGADGVNSIVRQTFAKDFQPDLSTRPNKIGRASCRERV